jgi:CDP-glucose 4,6-dehydratase
MANLEEYRNKRVLITGANGLLGAHLVELLLNSNADVHALVMDVDPKSYYVRNLDHANLRDYAVDLNDKIALERVMCQIQPQVIFHLAAETQVKVGFLNPFLTYHTNFIGTLNLIETCRNFLESLERIVIASTDKAYGETKELPYTEETELRAHGPYDTSKACMDLMAQSYSITYGLPISILRAGNIYGEGDLNFDRIVPGVIKWLLNSEKPILRGADNMIRDYIYVKDVATAYALAGIDSNLTEKLRVFNVSAENPLTVIEIYKKICEETVGFFVDPKRINTGVPEISEQHLNSSRIRNVLDWKPNFSIEEGLCRTIAWYKNDFSN